MTNNEKDTLLKDSKKVNYENIYYIFNDLQNKYEDFNQFTADNSLMTINNAVNLIIQRMRDKDTTPDCYGYYCLADNLIKIMNNATFHWLVSFGCNSLTDNSERTHLHNVNDFKEILKDFANGDI